MVKKATAKTNRNAIRQLTELVNVGNSVAEDLHRIGVMRAQQLIGRDPWKLYCEICTHDKVLHDPCLIDVLISVVDYMNGGKPQKWWKFTARRKSTYGKRFQALRTGLSRPTQTTRGNKKRRGTNATA